MDSVELINKYFPDLSEQQQKQFAQLGKLYSEWNEKINVISRKDIDHIYERHILHALSIAKFKDLNGKIVFENQYGNQNPGIYSEKIDISDLSNGVYLYEVAADNNLSQGKIVLTK